MDRGCAARRCRSAVRCVIFADRVDLIAPFVLAALGSKSFKNEALGNACHDGTARSVISNSRRSAERSATFRFTSARCSWAMASTAFAGLLVVDGVGEGRRRRAGRRVRPRSAARLDDDRDLSPQMRLNEKLYGDGRPGLAALTVASRTNQRLTSQCGEPGSRRWRHPRCCSM